jgi:hypothetical protein
VTLAIRDGKAKLHGVMLCNHVWDCPTCSSVIRTKRGAEIARVVDASPGAWRMVSLTIRHNAADDFGVLLRGLSKAWARMRKGRAGQARFEGVEAYVRTWDITIGARGWHPHVHVLLKFAPGVDARAWCDEWAPEWVIAVRAELGPEHTPDEEHGTFLSPPGAGKTYVAKMGLEVAAQGAQLAARGAFEVAAVASKKATGSSRNPWQLAHDLALHERGGDVLLWVRYQEAVRGRRCIEWSRTASLELDRLKRDDARDLAMGDIAHLSDEAREALLATEYVAHKPGVVSLVHFCEEEWRMIRAYERRRPPALYDVLEVASRAGPDGVRRWFANVTRTMRGQPIIVDRDAAPRSLLTDEPDFALDAPY